MTEYELGFEAGELAAWRDRNRIIKSKPREGESDYAKGFRDGYTPRSLHWRMRHQTEAHWSEQQDSVFYA